MSSPSTDAATASYRVSLPMFEGPLDLLLHLIQEHELDIRDIPIAFVAEKYRETIMLMQELDIDLAGEYLVMAATLAHIKSKTLLPAPPPGQEDEVPADEEDPRAELIRRLLEYQKYKQAAAQLGERSVLGRDVFARGAPAPEAEGPAPLAAVGLFKLLEAFQAVLTRSERTIDHQVEFERVSITDRIHQLVERLGGQRTLSFDQLFEGQRTRADLIVTFLALLEMTRLRMTRLVQAGPLEPITVELTLVASDEATLEGGGAAAHEPAPGGLGDTTPARPTPPAVADAPEQPDQAGEPTPETVLGTGAAGVPPNEAEQ